MIALLMSYSFLKQAKGIWVTYFTGRIHSITTHCVFSLTANVLKPVRTDLVRRVPVSGGECLLPHRSMFPNLSYLIQSNVNTCHVSTKPTRYLKNVEPLLNQANFLHLFLSYAPILRYSNSSNQMWKLWIFVVSSSIRVFFLFFFLKGKFHQRLTAAGQPFTLPQRNILLLVYCIDGGYL